MIQRFVLVALIVGLMTLVAASAYRRYVRPVAAPSPVPAQAQPRKLYATCEDHRTALPSAPVVEGLDPEVLVFSSDCRWLVAGNRAGSIHVFDRETGRLVSRVDGFGTRVTSLLVSADDKYLF